MNIKFTKGLLIAGLVGGLVMGMFPASPVKADYYDDDDYYYDDDDWYQEKPVVVDMNTVSLDKTSLTSCVLDSYYGWNECSFEINVIGMEGLSYYTNGVTYSCESTNEEMNVYGEFENGKIYLYVYGTGQTNAIITINGKVFTVKIRVDAVSLSCGNTLIMAKGNSKTIKVKNASEKVKWSSTAPSVAAVTSTGQIKAKSCGNTVIIAEINGAKLGCALSVVTANRKKVLDYANMIGRNWTYSQPKRMQNKYYDCSSLVWKSYSKYEKKYFGDKHYAPVAADIAKYCVNHKKSKSGDIYNKIQKMKFTPGVLVFKTGGSNDRYKGIYHVEMMTGYICEGFNENGTPIIGTKWAARGDNYSQGYEDELWAQP